MIVCLCENINSRKIQECFEAGMTLEEIRLRLGLGNQCGSCLEAAEKMIRTEASITIEKLAIG